MDDLGFDTPLFVIELVLNAMPPQIDRVGLFRTVEAAEHAIWVQYIERFWNPMLSERDPAIKRWRHKDQTGDTISIVETTARALIEAELTKWERPTE